MPRTTSRRLISAAVVYLLLGAAVWVALGSVNLPPYRRMVAEGVPTAGIVTAPDCGNHSNVRYTFQAAGQTIEAVGRPGPGNPPCAELRAGDGLVVWYVPADPGVHALGEPGSELENEQMGVGLAAVVIPGVLIGAIAWSRRR